MSSCRVLAIVALLLSGIGFPGCRLPARQRAIASDAECRQYADQGLAALEQGRFAAAEPLLAKAVESSPNDPRSRRHWAEALWNQGRRAEAIGQLGEAVGLAPDNIETRVRLSEMRLEVGQLQEARREIEAAIDLRPDGAAAWGTRARVLHALGDREAALADYHRALGYAPGDQNLLLQTAELYRELNQPAEALAMVKSLLGTYASGEEPQRAIYLEGLAYAALGRCDEAAASFSAALGRGGPTPELLYQLASAESRAGRPREAATAAEAALQLDSNHEPSRRLSEQLGVARPGGGPTYR
jgi:tetratricopeptide (TPR) repeat protein